MTELQSNEIFVAIKKWDEYQAYKDGRPVHWIKLHIAIRSDYGFARLPDATKAHLLMIWTLAPEHGNRIPLDPAFLEGELHATEPIDLDLLLSTGFLVPLDGVSIDDARKSLPALDVRDPDTVRYRTNAYARAYARACSREDIQKRI